jgi:hypothetical protein
MVFLFSRPNSPLWAYGPTASHWCARFGNVLIAKLINDLKEQRFFSIQFSTAGHGRTATVGEKNAKKKMRTKKVWTKKKCAKHPSNWCARFVHVLTSNLVCEFKEQWFFSITKFPTVGMAKLPVREKKCEEKNANQKKCEKFVQPHELKLRKNCHVFHRNFF